MVQTPLSFDLDGWIDGVRMNVDFKNSLVGQIAATVGTLDQSAGDMFNRSWDVTNKDYRYFQVHISGLNGRRMDYVVEINSLPTETYSRLGLKLNVEDLAGWLVSTIAFEQLLNFEGQGQGFSLSLLKEDKAWRAQVSYVDNAASAEVRSLLFGATRPEGRHALMSIERALGSNQNIRVFSRYRRCVDSRICGRDDRFEIGVRVRR
jgi:hypothetical protein